MLYSATTICKRLNSGIAYLESIRKSRIDIIGLGKKIRANYFSFLQGCSHLSSKYAIEYTDGLEYLHSSARKFGLDHSQQRKDPS